MKRPRLSALRSWSAGQLSLLILAGILSVWVMGAMAYGLVSNLGLGDDSSSRSVPTTSRSVGLGTERELQPPQQPTEAPSPATQAVIGNSSFGVECIQPRAIPRQSSQSFNCQITSRGGFSQAVAVSCANLPRGLTCEPEPSIVTPPANGIAGFKLALTNYDVAPGRHQFKVVAGIPNNSAIFNFPFDTSSERPASAASPPAPSRVDIECATGSTRLIPGQSIAYKCTYSSELFYGNVATSCSGTSGISCEISPRIVTPRDGQPADATLSLNVAPNMTSAGSNQVIGVYGEPSGAPRSTHKFTVDVPPPDYAINCSDKTFEAAPGAPDSVQCRVSSASGYVGPLHLKVLAIDPNGPNASVAPAAVQVGPGGSQDVTVSFASPPATAPGDYRYGLGVHADERETFTPATGDTPHNVVLTVSVPQPAPSPSPSPSPPAAE